MNNDKFNNLLPDVSNEMAWELYNFLNQLTRAFESKYFAQIHSHLTPDMLNGSWWRPADDIPNETDFYNDDIPF